jgi:hypothetical protein
MRAVKQDKFRSERAGAFDDEVELGAALKPSLPVKPGVAGISV